MASFLKDPHIPDLPEVRLAAVGLSFLPAATIAHRLGVGVRPTVVAFAVVGVLVCLALPGVHAAGLGVTAWAMVTGFVVNGLGQLSFAPADLGRLVLLLTVCVAASRASAYSHPFLRKTTNSPPHISTISSRANG